MSKLKLGSVWGMVVYQDDAVPAGCHALRACARAYVRGEPEMAWLRDLGAQAESVDDFIERLAATDREWWPGKQPTRRESEARERQQRGLLEREGPEQRY